MLYILRRLSDNKIIGYLTSPVKGVEGVYTEGPFMVYSNYNELIEAVKNDG